MLHNPGGRRQQFHLRSDGHARSAGVSQKTLGFIVGIARAIAGLRRLNCFQNGIIRHRGLIPCFRISRRFTQFHFRSSSSSSRMARRRRSALLRRRHDLRLRSRHARKATSMRSPSDRFHARHRKPRRDLGPQTQVIIVEIGKHRMRMTPRV